MEPITLDPELASQLTEGMRGGGTGELPFPVLYAWALNGQASYKQQGGALYFGGWACKAEDMNTIAKTADIDIPPGWSLATVGTREGGEYEAYVTRSLIVAPISKRQSWLLDDKRYPEYVEGGRHHVQALTILGMRGTDNSCSAWGPVVLTAKGYQARNLLDSFSRWEKATASTRYKIAPGVPAWCFYLAVGTFGKERISLLVGKKNAQSPITPIVLYGTDGIKEELLASLFVGSAVAARMGEYQAQAREWLKAWAQPVQDQMPGAAVEGGNGIEPPEYVEEEVPF